MAATKRPLVLILDPTTGALVARCQGPEADGRCPRAVEGEPTPCTGKHLLPAHGTGGEGWRFAVTDDGTDRCPIAWLMEMRFSV